MRVGDCYALGARAEKSGLLWYETKLSKQLHVENIKGVGPIIMPSTWSVRKK